MKRWRGGGRETRPALPPDSSLISCSKPCSTSGVIALQPFSKK